MAASFAACMALAAAFNHLSPKALPQIKAVEGGANSTARVSHNGSIDYGCAKTGARRTAIGGAQWRYITRTVHL